MVLRITIYPIAYPNHLPLLFLEFERPISAANHKGANAQKRNRGSIQSRALDEITRTFMIRRLQEDVLKSSLPPREEVLLFCRPSEEQCNLYHQMTKRGLKSLEAEALQILTNIRKLCAHPNCDASAMPQNETPKDFVERSGKLSVLQSLLLATREQTPDDKVVIVSNYTSALSLIEDYVLRPNELTYQRLDGSIELSKRHGVVDTFNKTSAARNFAFLLSSKAGGCGLNLIGANRLVMFDPDW